MASLQSIAIELASLLDDSQAPVYVLDEDRRIIFCNPACAADRPDAGELIGQQCVYQAEIADASPAGSRRVCALRRGVFRQATDRDCRLLSCRRRRRLAARKLSAAFGRRGRERAVIAVLETADCPVPDSPADAERTSRTASPAPRAMAEAIGTMPCWASVRRSLGCDRKSSWRPTAGPRADRGRYRLGQGPRRQGDSLRPRVGSLLPLDCSLLPVNSLAARCGPPGRPARVQGADHTAAGRNRCDAGRAQSELEALQASRSRRVRLVATAAKPLAAWWRPGDFPLAWLMGWRP